MIGKRISDFCSTFLFMDGKSLKYEGVFQDILDATESNKDIVISKGRQVGVTNFILALQLAQAHLIDDYRTLHLTHSWGATECVAHMLNYLVDESLPSPVMYPGGKGYISCLRNNIKKDRFFGKMFNNDSAIVCGLGNIEQVNQIRGYNLNRVILDEFQLMDADIVPVLRFVLLPRDGNMIFIVDNEFTHTAFENCIKFEIK